MSFLQRKRIFLVFSNTPYMKTIFDNDQVFSISFCTLRNPLLIILCKYSQFIRYLRVCTSFTWLMVAAKMYDTGAMVSNANVDVDIFTLKFLQSPSWLDWPLLKISDTHENGYDTVVVVTITFFIHVYDITEVWKWDGPACISSEAKTSYVLLLALGNVTINH